MIRVRITKLAIALCLAAVSPAAAVDVESVTFNGLAAFSRGDLLDVMAMRPSRFLHKIPFDDGAFGRDIAAIERLYRRDGYLQAAVTDTTVRFDNDGTHITLEIHEGRQTVVESLDFLGNEEIGDDILREHSPIKQGDVFRADLIERSMEELSHYYTDRGFVGVEIEPSVRIDEENHRAYVNYTIRENQRFSIGRIVIIGLEETKPHVVRRELRFKTGDTINLSELRRAQYRLYMIGLFQSVYIHPEDNPNTDGRLDVIVDVRETKTGEFNVSAGYGTEDQLRGKIEVYNNNIFGTARKAGFQGKISSITRQATLSTTLPRFLGTLWQLDGNLFTEYRQEPGYNYRRNGFNSTIGRELFTEHTLLKFTYRHENVRLENVTSDNAPDDITPTVRSLIASLVHDSRDNLFNTTNGIYAVLSTEVGGFSSKGSDQFGRITSTVSYFKRFTSRLVIGTSLDIGVIDTPNGIGTVPNNERFYAGGANSVRGFGYQLLGPRDISGDPTGGKYKLVWNVFEVRYPVWRWVNVAAFTDAGNIWRNRNSLQVFNLRVTPGFGIRINSPIGMARADIGFNPWHEPGEDLYAVQLGFGQPF